MNRYLYSTFQRPPIDWPILVGQRVRLNTLGISMMKDNNQVKYLGKEGVVIDGVSGTMGQYINVRWDHLKKENWNNWWLPEWLEHVT